MMKAKIQTLLLIVTVLGMAARVEAQEQVPTNQENAPALESDEAESQTDASGNEDPDDVDETREESSQLPSGESDSENSSALESLSEEDFVLEEDDTGDEQPVVSAESQTVTEPDASQDEVYRLDGVVVTYTPEELLRIGGSVHVMGAEELETLEYDDPHSVLLRVPGVYVRTEDGYGLRPNIGVRGASAERSAKLTLMEDGILFGPAPYSAPAAYYFPLMTRITGLEFFMGPAAVIYGPQTIGGALNLLTRSVPEAGSAGEVDLSLGRFRSRKLHLHWGAGNEHAGFLFDLVDLRTQGFKVIDYSDNETGFGRGEYMLRAYVQTDQDAQIAHRFEIKLGYAWERSNETYLGLSDEDFRDDPYRRYVSSQLDRMDWERYQFQLRYRLFIGDEVEVITTAYRHNFDRTWFRLNRFRDGPTFREILANPSGGSRQVFYNVLTGVEDASSDSETLMMIANERSFVSQGVQTEGRARWVTGDFAHNLHAGLRIHQDRVDRNHQETGYQMIAQTMIPDGREPIQATDNAASTLAIASWVAYGLTFFDLTLTPGIRVEHIENEFTNSLADLEVDNSQTIVVPGFGAQYDITDTLGVLAGVHQGFSPVAPGQPAEVLPERSINYEVGARYRRDDDTLGQAILFYNDYENLIGECTFSAGCAAEILDQQFNAGAVDVYGVELLARHRFEIGSYSLPIRAAYTFTKTSFQTSFSSGNPQFGDVSEGDELPYVPMHQASAQVGLGNDRWAGNVMATYVGAMREVAGQAPNESGDLTDSFVMLDAVGSVRLTERGEVYVRGENLLNSQPLVSRRPFGARPLRPLQVQVGFKWDL